MYNEIDLFICNTTLAIRMCRFSHTIKIFVLTFQMMSLGIVMKLWLIFFLKECVRMKNGSLEEIENILLEYTKPPITDFGDSKILQFTWNFLQNVSYENRGNFMFLFRPIVCNVFFLLEISLWFAKYWP